MGSLLSSISSSLPSPGAGTYTVLADTNGLFTSYLTQPGDSTGLSLAQLPGMLLSQLASGRTLGAEADQLPALGRSPYHQGFEKPKSEQ